jgi:hypothetical protein
MAIYEEPQTDNTETATGTSTARYARKKPVQAGGKVETTMGAELRATAPKLKANPAKISASKPNATKSDTVLKLLRTAKGVTVDAIMQATGWQAHSVRGFMSGVVRKKLQLDLTSEVGKDDQRRYRIVEGGKAG